MRPEVVGAFRLAMKHEEQAGSLWWGYRKRRWKASKRATKHANKAQKLYHKAAQLEARGLK
jgi:hypothetical protein